MAHTKLSEVIEHILSGIRQGTHTYKSFALDDKYKVFISSTSDLKAERLAISEELPQSFSTYRYERWEASKKSPKQRLEEDIKDSNVFVGVLGGKWGSPYPPPEDKGSIVMWEFETARVNKDLEIMAFVKQVEQVEEKQKEFIQSLSHFETGMSLKFFSSTEQLVIEVLRSLLGWMAQYNERRRQEQEKIPRLLHPYLMAINGVALLLSVVAFIFPVSNVFKWTVWGIALLIILHSILLILSQLGGTNGRGT